MRPLPAPSRTPTRRWVLRVPPDPHVRFDTNDYSLDPALVGRRVEVRVDQREVTAVALDTGELACRHRRCFAAAPHDHRARARPRAEAPARAAPPRRGRGPDPAAGPL